jgi:hypothetical protein
MRACREETAYSICDRRRLRLCTLLPAPWTPGLVAFAIPFAVEASVAELMRARVRYRTSVLAAGDLPTAPITRYARQFGGSERTHLIMGPGRFGALLRDDWITVGSLLFGPLFDATGFRRDEVRECAFRVVWRQTSSGALRIRRASQSEPRA